MIQITRDLITPAILALVFIPILLRMLGTTFITFINIFSIKSRLNKAAQHVYIFCVIGLSIIDILLALAVYYWVYLPFKGVV